MIHRQSSESAGSSSSFSPRIFRRFLYYVHCPSNDSEKSIQTTNISSAASDSATESPSHPSSSSSTSSTGSRVSGPFRWTRPHRQRDGTGWPTCNVIMEEGDYDDDDDDDDEDYESSGRRFCVVGILWVVAIFTVFCLIVWGVSRPYSPRVAVKSVTISSFYFGEGSDYTGVPTKLMTLNCSVTMIISNPAAFFGIHVSASPIVIFYLEIAVASGQLKRYYQPRKSQQRVALKVEGNNVPLYGAGVSLAMSASRGGVPLRLAFDIQSRGDVIGKLVRSNHRRHVSCPLFVDSRNTNKPINFKDNSCTFD